MGRKSKRSAKGGKLFYCPRCYYYYSNKLPKAMWNPSPSVKPVARTCNSCRANR